MKKYFSYLLAVALMLTVIAQAPAAMASEKSKEVSPNDAVSVAQKYINGLSRFKAGWNYDEIGQAVPCYDINGVRNAFIVPFIVKGKAVSYVTVSATKDKSPVLSASQSAPPFVNFDANKLGLDNNSFEKAKIIFAEPFSYFIEYPAQNEKTEIYDLKTGKVLNKAEKDVIKKSIHAPANPQKAQKAWETLLNNTADQASSNNLVSLMGPTSGYKDLTDFNYYMYDQTWSSYPSESCGPTSAAMIMEYWYNQGYTNIRTSHWYGSPEGFINHLCTDLGVLWGTSDSEWIKGFKKHVNTEAGYAFSVSSVNTYFSSFRAEIDSNRPVGLGIDPNNLYYSNHFVAGRGYYYDYSYDPNSYIIINNCWGSSDTICYDEYAPYLTSMIVRP